MTRAKRPVSVSKSAHQVFRQCRLRWFWEKVERRPPDREIEDGPALVRGRAGHEAVAALLRARRAGQMCDRQAVARRAIARFALPADVSYEVAEAALVADDIAMERGGHIALVEWGRPLRHTPSGTVLRGRVDAVIEGGAYGGIEIIDWTFGRARAKGTHDVAASVGTGIYCQMVARALPARPITVTEVALLDGAASVSVTFASREELLPTLHHLSREAAEMSLASTSGEVAPTKGLHCRWCVYGKSCPIT